MLLFCVIDTQGRLHPSIWDFSIVLVYFNSVVNAVVYLYFNKLFRDEAQNLLYQLSCREIALELDTPITSLSTRNTTVQH